jgi:proline iminopeptidase
LEDPKGYTVENMVEDVEAVRRCLHLGKMSLLGHSYGGVLAEAYALKYQRNLSHLILCSTFYSTKEMNAVLQKELSEAPAAVQKTVHDYEKSGLFGKGPIYRQHRYPDEYMIAAWGIAYFPFLYQRNPDPNYDPVASGQMSWDLYREMWGSHGEFIIDGNLKSVEYAKKLRKLHVPTLVTAGDHDECDPAQARQMQKLIPGAKLVIFPKSGHMTFVDQPTRFMRAIEGFLKS